MTKVRGSNTVVGRGGVATIFPPSEDLASKKVIEDIGEKIVELLIADVSTISKNIPIFVNGERDCYRERLFAKFLEIDKDLEKYVTVGGEIFCT